MAAPRTRTEIHDCSCSPQRAHGTQHTYQVHHCGCDDCRESYLHYLRELRQARAVGRSAYVPVGPAQAHLHAFAAAGVPIRLVAERLGYSSASIYAISRAARPTCRREVAEDILTQPLPRATRSAAA